MGNGFTSEQQAAIDARNCDLLVSAAAGSGKTAVLIARLIRMITDAENPVELDKLLVVTFTEAAASEMRQRLGEALRARLEANPDDLRMQRQLLILPQASITTIHSFCLQVIRANFAQLGIDPSVRVADVAEAELLKLEVLRALFERLYEDAPEGDEDEEETPDELVFGEGGKTAFLRLAEMYGGKVKDDELQSLVKDIYEFSRSKPWPEAWLLAQAESFRLGEGQDAATAMASSAWYRFFVTETDRALADMERALAKAHTLSQNPNLHESYPATLADDVTAIALARHGLAEGPEAFVRAMDNPSAFGRLSSAKSKTTDGTLTEDGVKALKERIQALRNAAKEDYKTLKEKAAFKPAAALAADMADLYAPMRALAGVVLAFADKFAQEKRRRNLVDFSDFEHMCLEALLDEDSTEDNPIPTAAALALQERFDEVLVDEYQDSNWVQELILLVVSRKSQNRPNRFMVGDLKQSIYRFRMANPELFRRKFASYAREADAPERLIGLTKNFRSRDGVLDGINLIFRQTMDEALGDVTYDGNAMLHFGAASYPPYAREADRFCELILTDIAGSAETDEEAEDEEEDAVAALSAEEAEAQAVAERLAALFHSESKMTVFDKNTGTREAEYRDAAILLRAANQRGETYAKALRAVGIPAYAGARAGYFASAEVQVVLAFLQIIDNPRQDLHLITVMHSPLYGFTADELVVVRGCAEGMFFDAVCAARTDANVPPPLRARLEAFRVQLDAWRDRALLTPIAALLQAVYDETGFYRIAGAMAGGDVRRANLTAIVERALAYERTSLRGLFHFIRYIERLQKSGQDMSEAKVLGENENVVRIMSIHKSKGLEFPIVCVCGLGQQFNTMDLKKSFVLHADLGFGPTHIDLENRVRSNTLKRYAVVQQLRREGLSEELRLLYVALTRAREKLILSGKVRNAAETLAKLEGVLLEGNELFPEAQRLSAKRYMDWVLPALLRHRDAAAFLQEQGLEAHGAACTAVHGDASRWAISVYSKAAAERKEQAEAVDYAMHLEALRGQDMAADHSGRRAEVWRRLTYRYDTLGAEAIPVKLSVSEIKRMHYALTDGGAHVLPDVERAAVSPQGEAPVFAPPRFITGDAQPNAAQRGTLLHTVLEHIDFTRDVTRAALEARVADVAARGFISAEDIRYVDVRALEGFMQSEIASRIRCSPDVRREVRFVVDEKPHDLYAAWDARIERRIVVHGVIDLMFREGDGFVLVDYKTDRIGESSTAPDEAAERYRPQIEVYKRAVWKMTGNAVSEAILYFFNRQIAKVLV